MTTPTDDIVIVAAARTPQGRLRGALASFTAPELGGFAIAGALAQGGIDPADVDPGDATDGCLQRVERLLLHGGDHLGAEPTGERCLVHDDDAPLPAISNR